MRVALIAACLGLGSAASAAPSSALCSSLSSMIRLADQSGKAIHLSASLGPEAFSCGPNNPDTKQFCEAAVAASGLEFAHRFPWLVRDCLEDRGTVSNMQVGEGWTGFRRLKRLTLLEGHIGRVAINVRYLPSADDTGTSNVYGKYAVTIWRPSAVRSYGS